jgi:hypothetical protein
VPRQERHRSLVLRLVVATPGLRAPNHQGRCCWSSTATLSLSDGQNKPDSHHKNLGASTVWLLLYFDNSQLCFVFE